ncbi:MAG: helix-turn-helix domain-containing protein [Parvibaculaceae bacterium]
MTRGARTGSSDRPEKRSPPAARKREAGQAGAALPPCIARPEEYVARRAGSGSAAAAGLDIGGRVKHFRKERGHSLSELSRLTGISEPTLSRVENGQSLVSAHSLYVLSTVLEVDITAFFEGAASPIGTGIRSVCRKGDAVRLDTARYLADVLCTDLANKKMHPSVNTVTMRTLEEVGGFSRHEGEEFIHVLSGRMTLASEFYEPLMLSAGDSVYIDSRMGHAYLSSDGKPTRILVVTTTEPPPSLGLSRQ